MKQHISREIVPLGDDDLFMLSYHKTALFDYPLHFHPDFELNLIEGTSGERIVGDSIENFEDIDLALIGSNLPHKWDAPIIENSIVCTIYFHSTFLESSFLSKRALSPIKNMLDRADRGIVFSNEVARETRKELEKLTQIQGFESVVSFLSILNNLSIQAGQRTLASPSYDVNGVFRESKSRRVSAICKYIEKNYHKNVTLTDLSEQIGMSESSLSHFFKKRTNRNIIDYLNEVRIGHATRMLLETTHTISEICFACGFSNQSNFNRVFKRQKNKTPSEYRNDLHQITTKY